MKDQCYEFLKNQTGKVNIVGFGSYGQVKLAKNTENNEIVAIKMIYNKNAKQQIDVHHKLNHPNIVKLINYYYEKQKNTTYMVLQYASGGTLNQKIKFGYGQLSKTLIKKYFKDICEAVKYLHENNFMHRDIKTQNILINKDNQAKLCDFGFASILQYRSTLCGTFQYMAPQMIQKKPYDYKIDIWALGILLFELIQGYAPFRGQTGQEVIAQMKKPLIFSNRFDPVQIDLIKKILRVNAQNRLQMSKILDHPYFKSNNDKQDPKSLNQTQQTIKPIKINKDIKQLKETFPIKELTELKIDGGETKKKEGQRKFDFLGKKKIEKVKQDDKVIKRQQSNVSVQPVKEEIKKQQKPKQESKKQFKPYIPPSIQNQRNGIKSPLMKTPIMANNFVGSPTILQQGTHYTNNSMQVPPSHLQSNSFAGYNQSYNNPNCSMTNMPNKQFAVNNSYTLNQPPPPQTIANHYNQINYIKPPPPQNFYIEQRTQNNLPISTNPQINQFSNTNSLPPWRKS